MMSTYHIRVTPIHKRKRLFLTKEVDFWYYDVHRDDGQPFGRFNSKEHALEQKRFLEKRDAMNCR